MKQAHQKKQQVTLVPKTEAPANTPVKPVTDAKPGEPATPKAKKKASDTVVKWRATKAFPHEGVITLIATNNPKSRGAAARFAIYKNGQTVGQYIEASHKAGNSKALAAADVRWDVAAGFIKVEVPASK